MKRLIIFFSLFLSLSVAKGQSAIGFTNIVGIDTVYQDSSLSFSFDFYDNSNFALGSYDVKMLARDIDSGGIINPIDTLFNDTIFVQTNDTVTVNTSHTFRLSNYDGGDNVVVVWPLNQYITIPDSIYMHIYMILTNGIEEDQKTIVSVYPNPTREYLYLKQSDGKRVNRVRIFNISGQLTSEEFLTKRSFDVAKFDSGVYIIQLFDIDNRSLGYVKFIKL